MIRLATEADIPRLGRLVERASAELRAEFGTPDSTCLVLAAVEYGIRNGQAVVIAETLDEIVGLVAWVWLPNTPNGSVQGLGTWVHPDFRRTHLSDAMRETAEEHCRKNGRRYVTGTAAIRNTAALESVKKRGFKVVGYEVRKDL